MRPLLVECPRLSSACHWLSSRMTTSSLYPLSKPAEVCLNSCSPSSKFCSKADSSYVLNGNISNNYNFYTCHLQPGSSVLPTKSPYNVSTYWLYSFSPPSGAQSASSNSDHVNLNGTSNGSHHPKFGKISTRLALHWGTNFVHLVVQYINLHLSLTQLSHLPFDVRWWPSYKLCSLSISSCSLIGSGCARLCCCAHILAAISHNHDCRCSKRFTAVWAVYT